jgi:DNA-directed RNA polymerase specialized sigma24 family protein
MAMLMGMEVDTIESCLAGAQIRIKSESSGNVPHRVKKFGYWVLISEAAAFFQGRYFLILPDLYLAAQKSSLAKPETLHPIEIISALQSGKTQVVVELYAAYRAPFFKWASRRFESTRQDFEDAWQVAVTAFFEQVTSGKLTKLRYDPKVWLFAVGYRHLLKVNRKTKRIFWKDEIDEALLKDTQLLELDWDVPTPDEWALVEKAMKSISPQCREILAQRFYEGKKIPDIMAGLGHNSENTTSATLSRCLKKLKDTVLGMINDKR